MNIMRSLVILTISINSYLLSAEASDISQLLDIMGESEDITIENSDTVSATEKTSEVLYKPENGVKVKKINNSNNYINSSDKNSSSKRKK